MRIGIDANGLTARSGGIGRYAVNLINHIAGVVSPREQHELFIFFHQSFDRSLVDEHSCIAFVDRFTRIKSNVLRKGIFLPHSLRSLNIDLFHGVDHIGLPFFPGERKCRYVLTVHDMITKLYPEKFTLKHRTIENTLRPLVLRNADRIITVSRSTQNDLLEFFPQCAEKTRVIYQGVDPRFSPRNEHEVKTRLVKYSIDFPYALFLGTLEPRKNIVRVVQGFLRAKEKRQTEHKLVITGRRGWLFKGIINQIEKESLSNDIIFTGFVEDEDLPHFYTGADIFLYPSLYEGFGLPVLEAMACDTPVITSNLSSLPEVAGDAALLIDPMNVEEIADSIVRLLTDDSLRRDMQKKGSKRAEFFSWKRAAEQILDLYEEAVE